MSRWLMIVMHCTHCDKDMEYLWDKTYEDLNMVVCDKCGNGNMYRRTGVGAKIATRTFPDGTYRGEDFERCKRLANLQCELGEHFHGTEGYKEVAKEIVANGGTPTSGDPALG